MTEVAVEATMPATTVIPKTSTTAGACFYEGSKNFWRTRTNVEVRITEHPACHLLEIITFNVDTEQEGNRIYVNLPLMYSKLNKEDIDNKVSSKIEELSRQRKTTNKGTKDECFQQIQREMISTYITSRLTLPSNPTLGSFQVNLTPMTGDVTVTETVTLPQNDGPDSPVIQQFERIDIEVISPPATLEPLFIQRRRKTTSADFAATLGALKEDSKKLNNAMCKAQKAAGLMLSSVQGFQHEMSRKRFSFDPEHMSIAKLRWLKAGRKVILLNTVDKVKKRLERYSLSDIPSKVSSNDKIRTLGLTPSKSTTKLPTIVSPRISEGLSSSKTQSKLPTAKRAQ